MSLVFYFLRLFAALLIRQIAILLALRQTPGAESGRGKKGIDLMGLPRMSGKWLNSG
jgi:hypothetical protein